jgi:hypothetical protein
VLVLMCGGRGDRSVAPMINTTHIRTILIGTALAALLTVAVLASTAGAAGKTETLRVFSKVQTFTYTKADGTVSQGPPQGQPQPGDSFEIESLDYRGNHKQHSAKPIGAEYLQCSFSTAPEPDCFAYVAIGRSLLRFHGMTNIGATGKWKSAKILSNKDVNGDSDVVVRLVRR